MNGLDERALRAWCGTTSLAALARARLPSGTPTRAGALLALFVGGEVVPRSLLPSVPPELVDMLDDERVVARHSVLPLGASLLVCDRRDASTSRELVPWPDDSSYHLATAIPRGRRERWIDLACGSAFAQLARPELAAVRIGVDLNPRAVAFARLGAVLSNVGIELHERDVAQITDLGTAELVTCNAPILDGGAVLWTSTRARFFDALFAHVPALVAPGGLVVVHAVREAIPHALPGTRAIAVYTPPGERAFCVLWWRPDGPSRVVEAHRALTVERPHVDAHDLEALTSA